MKIIGLTGGIGSGKSEAARRFQHHGIPAIDADALGHKLLLPGGSAESDVRAAFGDAILSDGVIDRTKLGAVVFENDAGRKTLNAIVHPLIAMAIGEWCAQNAQAGHTHAIVDAALLGEHGRRDDYLDGLILVLAPEANRLSWLAEKRGMAEDEARRRMAAQTPPESKVALADWVIQNDGDLNHDVLYDQVDAIAHAWSNPVSNQAQE